MTPCAYHWPDVASFHFNCCVVSGAWRPRSSPTVSFGLEPQITAPAATADRVGSEQWSAGLANVLFGALQPFAFYQLGGDTYLRPAPIWVYNFENDDYGMPVGIGIEQVLKKGKNVYNIFIEPQFSLADAGPGQPEWQVYFALNMQFY